MENISLTQRIVEINTARNNTLNPVFDTVNFRSNKYSSITLYSFSINKFHENFTENKTFSRKDWVRH